MHHDRFIQSQLFAASPPVWPEELAPLIRQKVALGRRKLVVLDDDPTGTQTVHGVPVLTGWDVPALREEFRDECPCFYLLTNSRSLSGDAAAALNREIARNLQVAAREARREFVLVSRSDSTLRGHFPVETDALSEIAGPFQATIITPYFEAGGRYTVGDIHYVAEGEQLIPAAQTAFARDPVFGYRHSDLRDWVEEKTAGRVRAAAVRSIGLEMLRPAAGKVQPVQFVTQFLLGLPRGSHCIVNACHPRDMDVFALASLQAEEAGARLLYRTAAQFVAARLGLPPQPLWRPEVKGEETTAAGLVVVGSYVPKTTEQLQPLLADSSLALVELHVDRLLGDGRPAETSRAAVEVNEALRIGRHAVVYTSRTLASASDAEQNLAIGRRISAELVDVIRRIEVRPQYLVAKGGITSSDVATQGLGVKRALVMGQIAPGVPVWKLGPESRFPDLPYVVFPGNVGGPDTLSQVMRVFK